MFAKAMALEVINNAYSAGVLDAVARVGNTNPENAAYALESLPNQQWAWHIFSYNFRIWLGGAAIGGCGGFAAGVAACQFLF